MLDVALAGFIGLFLALGLKRPFFWVLAYIYIDVVAPQKIGWSFIQSLPVSLIAFAVDAPLSLSCHCLQRCSGSSTSSTTRSRCTAAMRSARAQS